MTLSAPVTLEELEQGSLFVYKGTYALKTEYRTEKGAIEAYIVGSGEFFWGGVTTPEEQSKLIVVPVNIH